MATDQEPWSSEEDRPTSGAWSIPGAPTARPYDPGREVERPGSEVNFPPIDNGLDYLLSVTEHLAAGEESVSARDLKYAVLHLQAAAEVLLKYRLQLEHWTLVFKNPGTARRAELDDGSLPSCTTKEALERLRHIVGISITDKETKLLQDLAETRNKLQHHGLTAKARAVEARTCHVLDFLVRFLAEHLIPGLSREERERIEIDMERIRGGLTLIQGFVTQRRKRLRGELEPLKTITVRCPHCTEWALVLEREESTCRFCTQLWEWDVLKNTYSSTVDPALVTGGAEVPFPCPDCNRDSLVMAITAGDPTNVVCLCFHCPRPFPDIRDCRGCGSMLGAGEDPLLCSSCGAAGLSF
ncbi:hypothetical protein FNQ90_15750 [Streptomyces alkaliphilus]|uniref:Uncharacterized protein n=1 Tax=Streptomyces alkaliphilus TaxID=1472722 RepID=A0A7W3Y2Q6_9ACTN|nr:hypothetical protein [Streptomyces alkaliphilus]MBB0245517.1 hypothetical protein [Streptomyces alkaliphilus]